MIKDLKLEQIKMPITIAIGTAFFIKGSSKIEGKAMNELAGYVSKTLKESFSTYRIPEICQAIELGSRGELFKESDMHAISPENIFKWIHRFNDQIRKEAREKQKKHEEKLANERSEEEHIAKERKFEALIIEKLAGFPDSFKNENYGSMASYYRHIDKKGIITFLTLERKIEIMAQAEELIEKNKKDLYDEMVREKTREEIEKRKRGESISDLLKIEYPPKIIAEAMALNEVFTFWKESEYELKF